MHTITHSQMRRGGLFNTQRVRREAVAIFFRFFFFFFGLFFFVGLLGGHLRKYVLLEREQKKSDRERETERDNEIQTETEALQLLAPLFDSVRHTCT